MFLATVSLVYCSPTLDSTTIPPAACYLASLLVFLYQTLDNTDGRQARRTKASRSATRSIGRVSRMVGLFQSRGVR